MNAKFKVENPYVFILMLTLGIQILGYAMYINANGSAIGKTLWFNFQLPDRLAYGIDFYIALAFFPLLAFGLIKKNPWPFYLCFVWLGTMSALTWYQGGSFSAPYSIFAHNNRYILPACLALWIHAKNPSKTTYEGLSLILTISIAVVFITHGIEAIRKNPVFIDYTLKIFRSYTPFNMKEKHAVLFLIGVGVQDILLAIAVLWKPNKWVLAYMAFWGFWTASLRTVYSPNYGLAKTLLRAANGGVPLVLCLQYFYCKGFPAPPVKSSFELLIAKIKGNSK